MLTSTDIQLACRVKLLTLVVCTTGSVSLAATATGYSRLTGSFLTDGFAPGEEITPAGFVTNTVDTITAVTALTITTRSARAVEASASGRSLTVGIPSLQAWEQKNLTPTADVAYIEEQYVPGPRFIANDGRHGLFAYRPIYSPRIYVPSGVGISADGRYADAILALFAPDTALTLPTAGAGESCLVRADAAPYAGQRYQHETWSVIPVTIPLEVRAMSLT